MPTAAKDRPTEERGATERGRRRATDAMPDRWSGAPKRGDSRGTDLPLRSRASRGWRRGPCRGRWPPPPGGSPRARWSSVPARIRAGAARVARAVERAQPLPVGPGQRGFERDLALELRSALAATRAWNASRPSVPARTSASTHSRTASSSSATVGRSWTAAARVRRPGPARRAARPGSRPSTSHSFSHTRRPIVASSIERTPAQVAPRLHDADHAPLERAQRLPPPQRPRSRPARRPLPRRPPTRSSRARPHRPAAANRTATPGRRTTPGPRWGHRRRPAQSRTAWRPSGPTSTLPRRKSPWTTASGPRRPVRVQPPEGELERGVGLTEPVEHPPELRHLVGGVEPRRRRRWGSVHRGHGRGRLGAEHPPGRRPLVVAQQLAGDRLAVEPLDDHAGPCRAPIRRRLPRPPRRARPRRGRPVGARTASVVRPIPAGSPSARAAAAAGSRSRLTLHHEVERKRSPGSTPREDAADRTPAGAREQRGSACSRVPIGTSPEARFGDKRSPRPQRGRGGSAARPAEHGQAVTDADSRSRRRRARGLAGGSGPRGTG